MRRLSINEDDRVLTAYAERATGPGWSNTPVWLVIASPDGTLRQECMQPDQQTADVGTLYSVSEAAHRAMLSAVKMAVRTRSRAA